MTEFVLTGPDGADPLGFMAALGVLRILDERVDDAALAWRNEGYWRPVLHGVDDVEAIVGAVMEDLPTWQDEPAIQTAYTKEGDSLSTAKGAVRDLKPKPDLQRALFDRAALRAVEGEPRMARCLAAFGTDVALDNNGRIKPTALHFTAGQQQFLKMVKALSRGITASDVRQALLGPWSYDSKLPSLSWTGTGQRLYALRSSDPSKAKRGSCPAAEWLAFVGLSFFVCVPRGRRVETTGVRGGWKDGTLTWPLWTARASAPTVASLLRCPDLDATGRAARGIGVVFRASICRSEQGGYGSFTPPRVV